MISVILYGRNDNYGYNLHKRAALSINCIAEALSGETDEIVFVDYNTPDELPTFPEAISDTLTAHARQRLRILRVRPYVHDRYKSRTHLAALEPIARNVGVRRSNSSNRWVLSTNTDLVFVSKRRQPLTDIVRGLPGGLYHTPRIEIPEVLWESLERNNPRAAIRSIRDWGWTLHLNEIVYGNEVILYDGPGDFQLLERQRLFDIHGFNEDMLLGWHVDSNLAKRMELLVGKVRDLGSEVYAYHCDHTRQATPMHSHVRIENDWQRFVRDVVSADAPEQAESWGCAQDEIEEIRLTSGLARAHICGLKHAIGPRLRQPLVAYYTGGAFDGGSYDARHVVPFLIDLLCSYPKNTVIGWHGARIDSLRIFSRAWQSLGFERPILVDNSLVDLASFATVLDTRLVPAEVVRERATVLVFDFGKLERSPPAASEGSEQKAVARRLLEIVNMEQQRFAEGGPLRKIVTIGAINNEYERLVAARVGAGYVPFSTRIRQGYVLLPGEQDWLPALEPGEAGMRSGRFVASRKTVGLVLFGGYKYLVPGTYRLNIDIALEADQPRSPSDDPWLLIELRSSFDLFAVHAVSVDDSAGPAHCIFAVPESFGENPMTTIEIRVVTVRPVAFVIRKLTIEAVQSAAIADSVLTLANWLPFLRLGPAGRREDDTVAVERGHEGYVVFGPYWPLHPGRYEMFAALEPLEPTENFDEGECLAIADVAMNADEIAKISLRKREFGRGEVSLNFEVAEAAQGGAPRLFETRIWSAGRIAFRLRSVSVRAWRERHGLADMEPGEAGRPAPVALPMSGVSLEKAEPAEQAARIDEGLNPRAAEQAIALRPGEAGIQDRETVRSLADLSGCIAYGSPAFGRLRAGSHRITIDWILRAAVLPADEACVLVELRSGDRLFALHVASSTDLAETKNFHFKVPAALAEDGAPPMQIRLLALRPVPLTIRNLRIKPVDVVELEDTIPRLENWLPVLRPGEAGARNGCGIKAEKGHSGYIFDGPNWPLTAGRYELVTVIDKLEPEQAFADDASLGVVDIAVNNDQLTKAEIRPDHLAKGGISLAFEVPPAAADGVPPLVETRVWTSGHVGLLIRAMNVRKRIAAENGFHAQPAAVAAAAQPRSRTNTPFTKDADMPIAPDISAWRDNPFSLLAQKWHEVPTTHEDRFSTKNLLMLGDDELLAAWNQRAAQVRGAKGIHVGDWEVYVYADLFKGRKVIEVGPGLGVLGISFLERGAKMTFVDVVESNLKMIERVCRIKNLENAKFLHLKQFDDLQQLDSDYDAVFAHGSLHHAPADVIKPEFTALASRLKVGGRFIMLAYPKSRWQNEGSLDFSQWGKSTDGEATPWAEWYDVPKLLKQLLPYRFHVLMAFDNIANGDMNWFDLVRTDGDPLFDETRPQHCEPLSGVVQVGSLASLPTWTGSSVTRSGDGVTVQTGPARWSYAAKVQIAGSLPAGPGWLSVDLQVDRGIVGVGAMEKEGEQHLCERQFGDGTTFPWLTMPVFIRIPDLSRAKIVMVRNAAVDGASKVLIRSINLMKQL